MPSAAPLPLRIIGVGNPLMADDGLGIEAARRLAAMRLPAGVEVVDGGTGGLTLLHLFEGARAVILIDAIAMGRAPGTILRIPGETLEAATGEGALSLHDTGLPEVLALARALETLPPLTLFGVEPELVAPRLALSPAVAAALAPLLAQVLEELQNLEMNCVAGPERENL